MFFKQSLGLFFYKNPSCTSGGMTSLLMKLINCFSLSHLVNVLRNLYAVI